MKVDVTNSCSPTVVVKPLSVRVLSITPKREVVRTWVDSRPWFLSFVTRDEVEHVYDNTNHTFTPVDEYFDKLLKQDMAYMYFSNVTLEIHGSILLRDFFYQFNFEGKWAKTNRYVVPEEFSSSSEIPMDSYEESLYEEYLSATDRFNRGEITDLDKLRTKMPLSFRTSWQMSMTVKYLVRILGYMIRNLGVNQFTTEVWSAFASCPELEPYLSLIGKYHLYDDPLLPSVNAEERMSDERYCNLTWSDRIGCTLFSHVIRHEGVKVGGFTAFVKSYISNDPTIDRTVNATFPVSFTVDKKRWKEILKIRTAWFALVRDFSDCNNWGWILKDYLNGDLEHDKKYLKYFDDKGNFLPEQVHSYSMDEDLKVRKGSRGQLPDAFALESRKILMERVEDQGMNPLLSDYLQMFDNGYVKDNPENTLRKRWESYE